MAKSNKISIFVDGEGFLDMLGSIFYKEEYDRSFIPPKADWRGFFTAIAGSLGCDSVKVFWYSVDQVDFYPEGDWKTMSFEEAERKLKRISTAKKKLNNLSVEKDRKAVVNKFRYVILKNQKRMLSMLAKRRELERKMVTGFPAIRMRKPGWQACSLLDSVMMSPKAIQGGMIADLFAESSNYDLAILLTGDGELVPAVDALSIMGKQFACLNLPVSGLRKPARVSRKLVDRMDFILDIPFVDMADFMGINLLKSDEAANAETTLIDVSMRDRSA